MLPFFVAMLMPMQIPGVRQMRPCSAPQVISTHAPVLRVDASTADDSLSLHVALLSTIGTSADQSPTAYHAFIRVDDQTIMVNLPPEGYISLTYPGLRRGIHHVRYGVYSGTTLWNGGTLCPRISRSSERS
jgi:hypothetical protein